jgi:hypothetical protein
MGNNLIKCNTINNIETFSNKSTINPSPTAPPAELIENISSEDPISIDVNHPKIYPKIPPLPSNKDNNISNIKKEIKEEKGSKNKLENQMKLKRLKPNLFFELNSNLKTNLLLKNIKQDYDYENNHNLLKGSDRAIIDRRHVFQIIKGFNNKNEFIIDYATNVEFLLGVLKFFEYNGCSLIFYSQEKIIFNNFKNRKFDKKEKKLIGKIINSKYPTYISSDIKDKLIKFL